MCTNCNPQIDTQNADAFGEKLLSILNGGSLAVMTSIGHRTGLFDTMSELPPSNSQQIADAAGLNERYVREWLGAMTVGGIVQCKPNGSAPLFSLPPGHAACLTRAASADNMSVFAQYISMMGTIENKILDCFKNGGGVPYSEFERFHEVMAEDSGQSIVSSLTEAVLPLVPGLIEKLEHGIDTLDIGCGRGRADLLMAKTFPNSRVVGYDLCEEPIEWARNQAANEGLTNVQFQIRNLTTFDEDADESRFDLVTAFDAIHDQARPDHVLAGVCKSLKPDGVFLMQDIAGSSHVYNNYDHPLGPLLYAISTTHCMTVSLAQGGMGLGTMWGEEKALEMLEAAGFNNVQVKNLDHDIQNNYYVARKQ
jgi:2-polyprenyl-3-methyl-5-hydroxy-6-metoxy-1,4-benzoquinol methylase